MQEFLNFHVTTFQECQLYLMDGQNQNTNTEAEIEVARDSPATEIRFMIAVYHR